jgi:Pycsar effector protein
VDQHGLRTDARDDHVLTERTRRRPRAASVYHRSMPEHTARASDESRDVAEHPFAAVHSRRAVDEMLSDLQQSLVTYTGQADLKANIVITTSSLVLTIVATRWNDHTLRPGLGAVAIGVLLALLSAITVVIPKFRLPHRKDQRVHFEAHENPLFFGHFASMSRERFVATLAGIAASDEVLYETQAADIHDMGVYLVEKKYRHLRLAYVFLGLAFVAGAVAQGIATIV